VEAFPWVDVRKIFRGCQRKAKAPNGEREREFTFAKNAIGYVTAPTSLNAGQPNFAQCVAVSWAGTLHTVSQKTSTF